VVVNNFIWVYQILFLYLYHTIKNKYTMKKLTVSLETFNEMILGLIKSGVTFEANEVSCGNIEIIFLGGY